MGKLPRWLRIFMGFTIGFTFVVVLIYFPLLTSATIVGLIVALLFSIGGNEDE